MKLSRYFGSGYASTQITVDGNPVGNTSTINWQGSQAPAQRSFDNIANFTLSAGTHLVELLATSVGGTSSIGGGSVLNLLESSAQQVVSSSLSQDTSDPFHIDFGLAPNSSPQQFYFPFRNYLSLPTTLNGNSAILLSSTAYLSGDISQPAPYNHKGDAMIGISFNGSTVAPVSQGTSSNNDICNCSELQAPLFSHAIYQSGGSISPTAI